MRIKIWSRILILILAIFPKLLHVTETHQVYLPLVQVSGPAYYVSPLGDDLNPGTYEFPWRTITKAANTVIPGDRVYIREGIYYEWVVIRQSGTMDKPIRFFAFPGESPVIDGNKQYPGAGEGLLSIHGDWVEIVGLEVVNSAYWGIVLFGEHDTATSVYSHHNWKSGIYINGDYGTVQNSLVWRNSLINEYGNGPSASSALVSSRDISDGITEYAIMRRNVVWENWGQGINAYESDHVTIEDNISHDNWNTNIYISDATNILCQRNFVYMNPSSIMNGYGDNVGIMMGDERYTPPSANIQVINNIAYGNHANYFWWQGVQGGGMNNVLIANNTFVNGIGQLNLGDANVIINSGDHINVRFEDNLVRQDGILPVIDTITQPGVMFSNNLWSKIPDSDASGPGDIIGDPRLLEVGSPFMPDWFRLLEFSPAIGHALSLPEVLVDYFGYWRDSTPDLGAVEYIP
jgi:hypothetical protein